MKPSAPMKHRSTLRQALLTMVALCVLTLTEGRAQTYDLDSLHFTQEHPLIYEDAWDLWPYAFLENGEPTGYNVELMKMIFEELKIPYVIKLKDTKDALEDLREGNSDVMLGMKAYFHDDYAQYGRTVLALFTHSVVYKKGEAQNINQVGDLANYRVIVHNGSFSHHLMNQHGWGKNAIRFNDMKSAILRAKSEESEPILWNTISLKWLLRQYHADNLTLAPIEMPHGEYRFMSNNPQLLAALDSTYAVLKAENKLEHLQSKWFYPEREETGIPAWIWIIANALVIIFAITIVFYTFYKIRERKVTQKIRKQNSRLAMTLKASGVRIWTYDIKRQTVTWYNANGVDKHEYTLLQFFDNYGANEMDQIMQALTQLAERKAENIELNLKVPSDVNNNELCDYAILLSVFHRDRTGKPTIIIGTRNDISQDRQRQQRVKNTLRIYHAIFDSVMVDMTYFNKEGYLTDLNDNACQTFGIANKDDINKHITIHSLYQLSPNDFLASSQETFYATLKRDVSGQGIVWYELRLEAMLDDEGQPLGYYGTGRKVTEIVRNYHLRKDALLRQKEANKAERRYVDNINYTLKVGGMRFTHYHPDTHILTIYSGINEIQNRLTQTRALHFMDEGSIKTAQRILIDMDRRTMSPINVTLKTRLRQHQGYTLFVQLNMVPITDEQGNIGEYFGICRDVSELKTTEEQLEIETTKAQEIETVKNAFLHNMNYEIRTPLNSIVGFAEFFQLPHDPHDEPIFISEIKNNSASLLKLINNILFLSRIDAHMIELKTAPTDFAMTFESMCVTYWDSHRNINSNAKLKVENHYEHMILDIDNQNIGHIVEQLIANAAMFTKEGSVYASYEYAGDHLIVSVEDTGGGIESELLGHIFERFSTGANNGTGLGLSICHELTQLMGGTINIKSTEGKGTTVWFTIPCKAIEIERKNEA